MPPPNASGVTAYGSSEEITLLIELNDIRGGSCNLDDLWVQYVLDEQYVSQPYKVGSNEYAFSGLFQTRSMYSYEVRITINDRDVIATFSGTATSKCYKNCSVCHFSVLILSLKLLQVRE